jgi:hypothetical protein
MSQAVVERIDVPFFDPFACIEAALAAAKRRNKLAVRARLAGRIDVADDHQSFVRFYMTRVHVWRDQINARSMEDPLWH